ncbi:MAG: hypothetical protein H6621_12985 [Halobacteriovoraceae bacterium]|nr:hypothetical protein [Halobacteriovoraceae bacterium]MCB9095977.1 hypothetical protein [Halobacteriovoraceae bacterium]
MKTLLCAFACLIVLPTFATCHDREARVEQAVQTLRELNGQKEVEIESITRVKGKFIDYELVTSEFYKKYYQVSIQDDDFCTVMKVERGGGYE